MPALRRIAIICISLWPSLAWASVPSSIDTSFVPHTQSLLGYAAIGVFVTAYLLVMLEERLGLHKSIPVMLAYEQRLDNRSTERKRFDNTKPTHFIGSGGGWLLPHVFAWFEPQCGVVR
mgnify:CR=1 FL=1